MKPLGQHCVRLIFGLTMLGCGRGSHPADPLPASALEDLRCEALEVAIDAVVPRQAGQPLVLRDSTDVLFPSPDLVQRTLSAAPRLDPTAVRNLTTTHARRVLTCGRLPSRAPVILLTDSTWNSLPGLDKWPAFYAAYPGVRGATSVSGIGLSESLDQAIVVVNHGCGRLCGSGHVVVLSRATGSWSLLYKQTFWIS